ncbi:MAG TPA: ABC transporter permease [Gemmataceae bacterium]|nr:ABC transporter permease [Gemmataceae bacterium]
MMTKPIAILKDSLREAWDSKTLLVMLVLAGLFLIGVASIGYTQATPQSVFENYLKDLSEPVLRLDRGKRILPMTRGPDGGPPRALANYTLTTFRAIKEAGHYPNGEYEFTLIVKPFDPTNPDGKKDETKKDDPKKDDPKKEAGPEADGFETAVALWHEDGSGRFLKIEGRNELDPSKVKVRVGAVTDEMVRDYFATELERHTQVPITEFERLMTENPKERMYRVKTGPSSEPRVWPVKLSLLFGLFQSEIPLPLGVILYLIQDIVISSVGGMIIILIAVIVTAFFIPNMLRPGSVVMLLSKPISRTTLLLFKYFGGLFFVLILSTFVVGGVWLITGIRAGVWAPGVFAVVPLMTLSFAILYAVSTLAAVLTRNSIVAILVTVAFGGLLWLVGKVESIAAVFRYQADALAELKKEEPEYPTWTKIAGGLNRALPRWHDIDVLTGHAVMDSLMTLKQQEARGEAALEKHQPSWGGTIGVTAVWIVAFLALACWWFSVKDY